MNSILFVGIAFLMLYRTKGKIFSLLFGVYLLCCWFAHFIYKNVLEPHFLFSMYAISSAMFFLAPGLIFLVLYFQKKRELFLVFSCVLNWISVFILLLYPFYYISPMTVGFYVVLVLVNIKLIKFLVKRRER